ncbi:MAG: NlpC/P60 family protein [Chthoniobacteraceae bacterium]
MKPTPTPVPTSHRHRHKAVVRHTDASDEDLSKPKPAHMPLKKKKATVADDSGDESRPSPSPEATAHPSTKKKDSKKEVEEKENKDETKTSPTASPEETPHSSSKKKIHKKAVEEDENTQDESTPSPTPKSTPAPSAPKTGGVANSAPNASIASDQLAEFNKQPDGVQKLLESALALTRDNLTYTYGSADPANGGMDCSGFVYYVLRENGFNDVPRDASGQYAWARKAKTFQAVLSKHIDSFELADLRPGDLLFWTGTYASEKDPPITHTMIYLGTEKGTHKAVMVGSTDGRSYHGKSRWGVSVFDFKANANAMQSDPAKQTHAAFVGYAHIPGLRDE